MEGEKTREEEKEIWRGKNARIKNTRDTTDIRHYKTTLLIHTYMYIAATTYVYTSLYS